MRICDECNFGSYGGRCIVCGAPGISVRCLLIPLTQDAYYCAECTRLEKDRDGCPKTANLGHSRLDAVFNRKLQQGAYVAMYHRPYISFQRG